MKLHVINLSLYNFFKEVSKDFSLFRDFIERKKKHNRKLSTLKGFEKIVRMIVKEYTKKDPQIQIGNVSITLYVSLVFLVLFKIHPEKKKVLTDEEI